MFGFISTLRTHRVTRPKPQVGGEVQDALAGERNYCPIPRPRRTSSDTGVGAGGPGDRPSLRPGTDGSEEQDSVPGNRGEPVTPLGRRGALSGHRHSLTHSRYASKVQGVKKIGHVDSWIRSSAAPSNSLEGRRQTRKGT